ncbi:MAG: hypothetical protein M0D57_22245 [Sphingobacteriales bacterium JAD_PAG50586_3]|nr:MAG: hypothetical protein M0D57_22245 [Sphingobacteriales bacterium JAD_PAG50586_3]
MPTFTVSFCDPLNPEVIDLGVHQKEEVLKLFNNIKWNDYLATMQGVPDDEIHYSPSFSAANSDNNAIVSVSALDGGAGLFYIMYFTPLAPRKIMGIQIGNKGVIYLI